MKTRILSAIFFTVLSFSILNCGRNSSGSFRIEGVNLNKDASYAIGMSYGATIISEGLIPDLDEFILGVRDYLTGDTRITEMEAIELLQTAYMAIVESMGAETMQEGIDFLVQNSRNPNVVITPSGLQYEVITEGSGARPAADSIVRVHYEGSLINGQVFDSSYMRGEPAEFPLNVVIPGWTEGVQLMSVGSKYRFFIPQELGYGEFPAGSIPPYSTLIFEVELLDIIE